MKYAALFRFLVAVALPGVLGASMALAAALNPPKQPFPEVLTEGQKLYMDWTDKQFAKFLVQPYAAMPEADRAKLEGQWLAELQKPATDEYYLAINRLAAIGSRAAVEPLRVIATERREKDNRDRWMAVRALGMIGDDNVVPALIPLLYHYYQNTRFWAQISLARLTGVNFGSDWRQWGQWWNGQGRPARFDATPVTWTTRADWADPERMRASDVEVIARLKAQAVPAEGAASATPAQAAADKPRIVSTVPAIGAKDVSPDLKEILVTFDQDMSDGFSWTGGGALYPKTTDRPHWKDARTCALPVALEPGKPYRVGINSTSYQNFRSKTGQPAYPNEIFFTTVGASSEQFDAMAPPRIVMMIPAIGATNVSPSLTELRVTFDREMGGGFSWTGGGENYPEGTGRPQWSPDKRTCTMPVKLKPNWTYRLGINSPSHKNFKSANGVSASWTRWTFQTGAQ